MNRLIPILVAVSLPVLQFAGDSTPPPPGQTSTASGQAAAGGLNSFLPLIMVAGMIAVMYFLVIRPQKKEESRRKEMVNSLKVGDEVVTIGGEHGEVTVVGETTIDLRLGRSEKESIVVTYERGAVTRNVTGEARAKATAK